jgi:hypothetical protein
MKPSRDLGRIPAGCDQPSTCIERTGRGIVETEAPGVTGQSHQQDRRRLGGQGHSKGAAQSKNHLSQCRSSDINPVDGSIVLVSEVMIEIENRQTTFKELFEATPVEGRTLQGDNEVEVPLRIGDWRFISDMDAISAGEGLVNGWRLIAIPYSRRLSQS